MTEGIPMMGPDQTITWRTYVLSVDAVCAAAGISVRPGDEIDVEVADRTAIRITVKRIEA